MNYTGLGGYALTSSVSGIHGMYLDFVATALYHSHSNYRAFGFQLRCLSE
ncbi:hypothetical protein [uncultured Rikenella sp.]|nr:hypothetical protein [uncultured Rikenella sp.]